MGPLKQQQRQAVTDLRCEVSDVRRRQLSQIARELRVLIRRGKQGALAVMRVGRGRAGETYERGSRAQKLESENG
eukprot:3901847-Pyramimonas_sp.AAC.1